MILLHPSLCALSRRGQAPSEPSGRKSDTSIIKVWFGSDGLLSLPLLFQSTRQYRPLASCSMGGVELKMLYSCSSNTGTMSLILFSPVSYLLSRSRVRTSIATDLSSSPLPAYFTNSSANVRTFWRSQFLMLVVTQFRSSIGEAWPRSFSITFEAGLAS